ncbi:MAG: XdhC family protein, partial [Actinomycetota bacterium]|nr:XdhC family protein [Actinomycetota bacterium]
LIVGDGPVSDALAPMAELVGWNTQRVVSLDDALAALPDATAIVVTSHHDDVDAPVLSAALKAGITYVGAMGSRATQARRREWLTLNGDTEADQARIHGPAGIDIGADGPPEIALSILAELVSSVRGGGAVSLKDRSGPIHPGLGPGAATCPTG